jgi:NADH-quinone oxidoreductase subunit G
VVLAGPRLAESPGAVAASAGLASEHGGRFVYLCRRANDRGALQAGVHPGLLPGGRAVQDAGGRSQVESAWGAGLPQDPGRDTAAILRAAADREIEVLFLVGVDPLRDFPDAALVRRALENVRYKVVVDAARDTMAIYADAMLPAAPFLENDGHYTDWEGRTQRLRPVRSPLGMARSDWQIFQGLSEAMGSDLGFGSLDDLHEEMGRLARAPAVGLPAGVPRAATWTTAAPAPSGTGSALTLFSYPLLVDEGRLSTGAGMLKAALEKPAFVELHPDDASRLGISDGDEVLVATQAGQAKVPAVVTDRIAPGVAFVPWNQPGLEANTLLSGARFTPAKLEPATATQEATV